MKTVIIVFLLLLTTTSGIQETFAQYYYDEINHRVTQNPIICTLEFPDSDLPQANQILVKEAEVAVKDWEKKLTDYTGNPQDWAFGFKVISIEDQQTALFDIDCDITIAFEREPPSEEKFEYAGVTELYPYGISDITIFYLELVYVYEEKIIDGQLWNTPVPSHYINSIDPYVEETLRHEIGHSLGLSHIPPDSEMSGWDYDSQGIPVGKSIMIEDFENFPPEGYFEIRPYDVKAVIQWYGDDGFSDTNRFLLESLAKLLAFGVIAALVVYVTRRRKNKITK
jgi:hypothetical protein